MTSEITFFPLKVFKHVLDCLLCFNLITRTHSVLMFFELATAHLKQVWSVPGLRYYYSTYIQHCTSLYCSLWYTSRLLLFCRVHIVFISWWTTVMFYWGMSCQLCRWSFNSWLFLGTSLIFFSLSVENERSTLTWMGGCVSLCLSVGQTSAGFLR